ncbi:MAG: glycosyl hydrolase [Acidobacteriota bacterium]|nr:MAG: glycosyl hydrolase [Acidobacteriota bacterium]
MLPGSLVWAQGEPEDSNQVVPEELYSKLEYRLAGPYRGGRSTAGVGVPGQPFTFYMGTTGGGVWKTDDAGESWVNISDGFFKAGSIGAIAVAKSDPNVLYVGTGSNAPRGNVSAGIGVYRSTDAGKTWKHIGLEQAGQISRIRISPTDPDDVYVAALGHIFGPHEERGVFRSRNGGESWHKILYVDDSTGAVDLAMDSTNSRILYAGMWTVERKPWTLKGGSEQGGVFKTVDGGENWEKLQGGLPEGVVGKIGVSISPADPDRVWVLIEAQEGGVFRSDDSGKTWTRVNKERKLRQRAWYYSRIYADPQDENTVYALNTSFYKSVDGGKTFEAIRVLHGDCHDLWVNPENSEIILQTNDGGAHVTLNGGKTWSTLNNQPTSEIYRLAVDNRFPYRIYGSQQDNSTISVYSRNTGELTPDGDWLNVGGCESGHIAVDPRNPNIVYAGCYGGYISRSNLESRQSQNILVYPQLQLGQAPRDLKYRFQWNAPIRLSPHDPGILYHTSQVVHRSTDEGHSWEDISPDLTRNDKTKQDWAGGSITLDNTGVEVYGTIFAFEESPHEKGVLWAGSDDGLLHISRNDGKDWTDITPPGIPEFSTVNDIELSAHEPGRAFLALYRYRFDDFLPYLYRTNDYGKTWESLADGENGIPANHFVRAIREDPEKKGLLYAGTEFGLYVSFDDGAHWQSLQLNLPVTPVTDMVVHQGELVVATQGRSFWILDNLNVIRSLAPGQDLEAPVLFAPKETSLAFFGQASERQGNREKSSPPNGAVIHYFLPAESDDVLTLEIVDPSGNVIRTFKSSEKSEAGEAEDDGFGGGGDTVAQAPAEKGLNKLVWDLRLSALNKVKDAVLWGSTGGALVLPGTYEVRLSRGDFSASHQLPVVKDPRVAATQADLEEQFELLEVISGRINELYDAVRKLRSVREQVNSLADRMNAAGLGEEAGERARGIAEKLDEIEARLMQPKNESRQDPLNFPPMLDNQLVALYGYVSGEAARPTEGATVRLRDLEKELKGHLAELDSVLSSEVKDFETFVEAANVPRVVLPKQD